MRLGEIKRYEKYKDSGVEWIGEVPEGWEILKIKYVANLTMGQSPSSDDCSMDEIGLPFLQGNAEFDKFFPKPKYYCNNANKLCKEDDILISVRAPVGEKNIADRVYGIGRGLCAITTLKISKMYLWHLFSIIMEELHFKSKGSTYDAVTLEEVKNLNIIVPSKEEQEAIANFLNQKTSEIDSLIADKEKLIELLQEQRQAIISEAVTKGLDKNVKMKDSGIEWIGEVPEGWEVLPLKWIIKDFESGVSVNSLDKPAENDEFGVLKTSCVYNDIFVPSENKVIVDEIELQNAKVTPKKDCIIISRMNTPDLVGASGFVPADFNNLFLPDRLWQTIYWNKKNINCLWLSYVLNAHFFRKQVSSIATGTSDSMKNISKENYLSLYIVLPLIFVSVKLL